ncbi:hypothetical protein K490DRAFT_66482 [Saccharata proteae CBS 121410]|uniref:F-box domain-containing protein n=1 Tax=Saccharata proteae CBS 121410 TaxID=1314787 RepID=A0A9P4LWN3_9PEZI|nr:hypothetical protein K490DRAFT_66482 [Saccharata proteae CBS 121410]
MSEAGENSVSFSLLPVEIVLRIIELLPNDILALRRVNKRLADIIAIHENMIADHIFAQTVCGREAADHCLPSGSYRTIKTWRVVPNFYRKFWRTFGNRKIYSDCVTTNSSYPFLKIMVFDDCIMKSPLMLAYVFSQIDPLTEQNPKWFSSTVQGFLS